MTGPGERWTPGGEAVGAELPVTGFWSRLAVKERGILRRVGTYARFTTDEMILRQGDEDRHLVIILTGSAKVFTCSDNGSKKILALCGPGSLIGEVAALTAAPRSAGVQALDRAGALI